MELCPAAIAEVQKINSWETLSLAKGQVGHVYAVQGKRQEALEIADKLRRRSMQQYKDPFISPESTRSSGRKTWPSSGCRRLERLLQSLRSLRPLERFVVKDKKRIFFVPVSNVLWIEATGNYACIHTVSDSHLLRETMAHPEEKLAPHHFIRVRKSAIVNSARISEIRPMFDGVYDIVLAEGTVVTSSRRYAHKLRVLLES